MIPLHFEYTTDSVLPNTGLDADLGGHDGEQARLRMPGEFERQDAMLIGCTTLVEKAPQVFLNLVQTLWRHVQLIGLVDSENRETLGRMLVATTGLPANAIQFVRLAAGSMWVRDYGPVTVIDQFGRRRFLDFDRRHLRPHNVQSAARDLAAMTGVPLQSVPLCLAGGNLLSNGDGVCLTTATVIMQNTEQGRQIEEIGTELIRCVGAERWAYVSPLPREHTGHIDLICTFVAADTLVVGQADPDENSDYAERLDKIADHLSGLETATGRLRIVRIPMPSSHDTHSRSYTNVVFANGTLVVPLYPETDAHRDRIALDTYRQLLPAWHIVGVDVSRFSHLNGALHCLTCNIPAAVPAGNLPERPEAVHPTATAPITGEPGVV
jgi:agmatine/peptidylarginine deiminase